MVRKKPMVPMWTPSRHNWIHKTKTIILYIVKDCCWPASCAMLRCAIMHVKHNLITWLDWQFHSLGSHEEDLELAQRSLQEKEQDSTNEEKKSWVIILHRNINQGTTGEKTWENLHPVDNCISLVLTKKTGLSFSLFVVTNTHGLCFWQTVPTWQHL